ATAPNEGPPWKRRPLSVERLHGARHGDERRGRGDARRDARGARVRLDGAGADLCGVSRPDRSAHQPRSGGASRWTTQFDPADTQPEPFHREDGSVVDVPMMSLAD